MGDPGFKISDQELSTLKVFLDVEGKPDVANPNIPGSPTVRPQLVLVRGYMQGENDTWDIGFIVAYGPKVNPTTGDLTKRRYDTLFNKPMDPESGAPEWIVEIARHWTKRMNGEAK